MGEERDEAAFRKFVSDVEPRLRRALVATYGPERGTEATAEALAYAWEYWNKVQSLPNPIGYLFRVGQSRTRVRKVRHLIQRPDAPLHWVEPRLGAALLALPKAQRIAVVLVFAAGFTPKEAAEVLGVAPSTVKTNTERGVSKLRRSLGVTSHDRG